MPPPQTNCTVKLVNAQGSTDEWRDSERDDGDALWSGEVRGYYREKREVERGANVETALVRRTLIVSEGEFGALVWAKEMDVTFVVDGEADDSTGEIKNVERARWAPAGTLQTTRLQLEDG